MKSDHSPSRGTFRHAALALLVVAASVGAAVEEGAAGSPKKVYVSKYRHGLVRDTVELQNEESEAVDIGGWTLRSTAGEFVFPGGTTIEGGGAKYTRSFSSITDSATDRIELIDDLKGLRGEELVDRVRWGCAGGAPAPPLLPDSAAIVRVPDPSFLPPQAPPDDAVYWTVDLTPTFGGFNDAPPPLLGSSLRINEVQAGLGVDAVELYNPSPVPVAINGWFLTSAAGVVFLNGVVPPFGFVVFGAEPLELEGTLRCDLFDQQGIRVDQKAWCGGPPSDCYGSCPDGASPSDGYDYETSGGGLSWFGLPCTLGGPNLLPGETSCDPASLPDGEGGPRLIESSWGEVRGHWLHR